MTTEEEISKNQDERDEARQDLRSTLTEVNAKIERAGRDFVPIILSRAIPLPLPWWRALWAFTSAQPSSIA
jgi:hypothetical protein